MTARLVRIYPLFERFWHWSQMLLVMALLVTGMRMRGLHELGSFATAVNVHTFAALALIVLWVFAIFWHLTTGTWKHYLPTSEGLLKVARFYAYGIFRGEHHPYRKAYWRKHNPLQAIAYLALKLVLFPLIWLSGLAYLSYNLWQHRPHAASVLEAIASVHALTAFAIAAFVIAHVYLLTTGHSFWEHVRPMVTGFDEVDLTEAEEAYLRQDEPGRIRG